MKADITVRITDTARDGDIPERVFTSASPISLDLPAESDEFIEAVESLATQHLQPLIAKLVGKVQKQCADYIIEAKKIGLTQPQLPLGDPPADPEAAAPATPA